MRRISISKVDANQSEIVDTFRKLGCSVKCTHTLAEGFPDLVVGISGETAIVEVKDGAKPPSARKLTIDEILFQDTWRGSPVKIIETVDDVIRFVDFIRRRQQAVNKSNEELERLRAMTKI